MERPPPASPAHAPWCERCVVWPGLSSVVWGLCSGPLARMPEVRPQARGATRIAGRKRSLAASGSSTAAKGRATSTLCFNTMDNLTISRKLVFSKETTFAKELIYLLAKSYSL